MKVTFWSWYIVAGSMKKLICIALTFVFIVKKETIKSQSERCFKGKHYCLYIKVTYLLSTGIDKDKLHQFHCCGRILVTRETKHIYRGAISLNKDTIKV